MQRKLIFMLHLIRLLIKFFVAIIVIGSLIIAGLIFFVDLNDYKDDISKLVNKHIGRSLDITGDISWSFTPNVGATIKGVALANAPGFTGPFLQAEEANVSVRLLDLFMGKVVVNGIELKAPKLYLAKNKSGKTNFDDLLKKFNRSNTNTSQTTQTAGTEGTATTTATSTTTTTTTATTTASTPATNELAATDATATMPQIAASNQPAAELDTALSQPPSVATTTAAGEMSTRKIPAIDIKHINVSNAYFNWNDQITGHNIEVKNLNINANNLLLSDSAPIGPINLSTTFSDVTKAIPFDVDITAKAFVNLPEQSIKIDPLTIKQAKSLLNATLLVDINGDSSSRAPTAQGEFVLKNLSPTILLELMKQPSPSDPTLLPSAINGKWDLTFANNTVTIKNFVLNINQGIIDGEAQLNLPSTANGMLQINSALNGKELELQKILGFIGQPAKVHGQTFFNAKLQTKGQQPDQFKHNLAANLKLNIDNGSLYGIDVHKLLEFAETTLNQLYTSLKENKTIGIASLLTTNTLDWQAAQGGSSITKFDKLTMAAVFNSGISKNANFNVTHPDYNVQGGGSINLPKNTLDLLIKALYLRTDKANSTEINEYILKTPLAIQVKGDINDPSIAPDMRTYMQTALQGLQRALLKDFATDVLKKILPTGVPAPGNSDAAATETTEADPAAEATKDQANDTKAIGKKLFESIFKR